MTDLHQEILDEVKGLRRDVASYATQTAANTTDLKWVKRLIGGLGGTLLMLGSHVLRKLGL